MVVKRTEDRIGVTDRPNQLVIERQKREQDAAVIALRRMLAAMPGSNEVLISTAA